MQTDHLGNNFKSVSAMTKHWGISRTTYLSRINMGWSVEKALTFTIREESKHKGSVVDHLGNEFKSLSQMLKHWGISPATYYNRTHKEGLSMEEALTKPIAKKFSFQEVTDHLGNKYRSLSLMARTYGIKPITLSDRLERGWSIREALTTPVDTSTLRKTVNVKGIKVQDHKGVWYNSYYELAKAYGLTISTLYGRLVRLGWSIEKALLTPTQERKSGTRKRGVA